LDVRIDDDISDSIDFVDDPIPFVEGVPLDIFRWSEGTPIEVRPCYFYTSALPTAYRRYFFYSRGKRLCYRSPNLSSVKIGCLGGPAKRAWPRRDNLEIL
jgi:hypothetical protein